MAADPILPSDTVRHDPDTIRIVSLLTSRVANVLSDRMGEGRNDQRNIVKIATKLTAGLDANMQTFVDLIQSMIREELTKEIDELEAETKLQAEESQVTAETVKTCSSIVSRVKRLRDMRRCADVTSGTIQALKREDETVTRATTELDIIDKEKLRVFLDEGNSLIKSYNDLIRQSE